MMMVELLQSGHYKLIETKDQTKILYLDDHVYAWPETKGYGEMLVVSRRVHRTDCILGIGHFNLYDVEDEPGISDITHLELEVGRNCWQGYLLLTGLPAGKKTRARIVPTHEVITANPRFDGKIVLKTSNLIAKGARP